MNLILYKNFTKRVNSTKQPTAAHDQVEITANLKENTSIENPTFMIDGIDFNVNYIYWQEAGRYYFVTDLRLQNRNIYEIVCSIDVLASYKNEIGEYTAFIERSASDFNAMLNDNAVSIMQPVNAVASASTEIVFAGDIRLYPTVGCYILRIIGSEGTIKSYAGLTLESFQGILAPDVVTQDLELDLKALGSLIFDATSYIVAAYWVPFQYADFTSLQDPEEIYLKYYPTGVELPPVKGFRGTTLTLNKPTAVYNDFRQFHPAISEYSLYLPGVGNIPVSSELMNTTLTVDVSVDMADGSLVYVLKSDAKIVASYNGNLFLQIPLGYANSDVKGILGSAMSTIGSIVSENIPLAAASAIDTVANVVSPMPSISGSYNSSVNLRIEKDIVLTCKTHNTSEFSTTVNGRPLCSNKKINTLSGFIKCGAAAIDLHGLESEKTAINNFLNSGFYYE